ncbi:MAG: YtxH domain-containing protein [Elusimicrobia bacterium]|nr:YtxH domain-containing protein [Elusimicrobiota bacterium]
MEKTTRRIPWGTIGLLVGGAVVGACLGVLYAPKKGEETRKDVKEWLKAKREKTRELYARSKQTLVQKKDLLTAAIKARRENGVEKKELVAA